MRVYAFGSLLLAGVLAGGRVGGQTADFSALPEAGEAPLTVRFSGTSDLKGLRRYRWDFGDGGSSAVRNPRHTYTQPGTYSVRFEVTRVRDGERAVVVKSGHIRVAGEPAGEEPPAEEPPQEEPPEEEPETTLDFEAEPRSGCPPLVVSFTNRSQGGGDWQWDFGDGGTSGERDPEHIYTSPGVYTVTLAAGGESETREGLISVGAAAAFSAEPARGRAPLAVAFTDESLGSETATRTWAFGDGATSGERDPTHVYTQAGVYTAELTVAGGGCESKAVTVAPIVVEPLGEEPVAGAIAFWPLDDCTVVDSEGGNVGTIFGRVECGEDRFGSESSSLRFASGGLAVVPSLPPVSGDFSLSLWVRPGSVITSARTFLDFPQAAGAEGLLAQWESRVSTIVVGAGPEHVTLDGVPPLWHHLSLVRSGAELRAYLDGVPSPPVAYAGGLGSALALGARADGRTPFTGDIDSVLYEGFARGPGEVADLLSEGGPAVALLAGGSPGGALTVEPGDAVEGLSFLLDAGAAGAAGGFVLERLLFHAQDLGAAEPQEPGDPSGDGHVLDVVSAAFLLAGEDGAELEEVGGLEALLTEEGSGVLIEFLATEGGPLLDLPEETRTRLAVELRIAPVVVEERRLRLSLETDGDLGMAPLVDAAGADVYLAAPRRLDRPLLEGPEVHVVERPPEIFLSAPAAEDMEARGMVADAELHRLVLAAGAGEGLTIAEVVYRVAAGSTLSEVQNLDLFIERDGVREVAGTTVWDAAAGEIRAEGLALEIPAGLDLVLGLEGDLGPQEAAAGGVAGGGFSSRPPAPPPHAVILLALGILLAAAGALLGARPSPRSFAPAKGWAAVPAAGSLWIIVLAAGCGPAVIGGSIALLGGSDGGSGGGNAPATAASFQVTLDPMDLEARGVLSAVPAVVRDENGEPVSAPISGPHWTLEPR
jgi:PKD repeat protein